MNQTEAASIVAYLNRAGLLWAMEGQAAVWSDALVGVSFPVAQTVVREMAQSRTSSNRSVTPGDVRQAVGALRRSRIAAALEPQPPAELESDQIRERAWSATYRRLIGDGLTEPDAEARADHEHGVTRAAIEADPTAARRIEQIAASTRRIPRARPDRSTP